MELTQHKVIKGLRTMHIIIAVLMAVVTFAAYIMCANSLQAAGSRYIHFNYIVPIAFVIIIFGFNYYYKNQLKKIQVQEDQELKLQEYRQLQIKQYGVAEFACLGTLFVFLMTRELNYVIYASLVVVYMLYIRPNDLKIKKDLKLEEL
ncbi:hypothetical protein GYB22_02015 [bacterium]|nr:hypothetical protein [bacterium]